MQAYGNHSFAEGNELYGVVAAPTDSAWSTPMNATCSLNELLAEGWWSNISVFDSKGHIVRPAKESMACRGSQSSYSYT